jgi:acetate kinase
VKILVLNAGSSSQKSRLYEITGTLPDSPPTPLWEANADWSERQGRTELQITTSQGHTRKEELPTDSRQAVIEHLLQTLWSGPTQVIAQPSQIDIVGHRVVHGGPDYRESTKITPAVKEAIKQWAVIAPVHNPADLEGIQTIERILPSVPQVAVFDTAFHSAMPLPAVVYPGPYEWFEQGIRRYGFHGISHQYCAHRTAQILGKDLKSLRLITCHLGNGASLAAIQNGISIDTTMGFTPLEGLMMGSRSGTVDPGILIYLMQQKGHSAEQLDTTLNKASGLLGISGLSSDMRQVLQARSQDNTRAKLAFDIYIHRLRSFIGAMLATLGGVDALVFAGGIGEHAPDVRAEACKAFAFLDLKLDPQKNAQSPADQDIAAPDSKVRVLIVQTQEDWEIARQCWQVAKTA